jgi:hypothetical protein
MVYLTALGQPIIVFNSLKAASELLDRRANIYSDRPRLIMGNEILSGGLFSAFLPYGDVWVYCISPPTGVDFPLIAGAVHDELLTKALQKMQLVVITPFFEKKAFFLHRRCYRVQVHGIWRNTSSAPPLPPPCLCYTITPPLKLRMTRPSQRSMLSLTAYPLQLSLERILLSYSHG